MATTSSRKPTGQDNDGGDIARSVGNGVAVLRYAAGLSQTELAAKCGVSKSTICRIESGERCQLRTVHKVSRALGLRGLDELLEKIKQFESKQAYDKIVSQRGMDPSTLGKSLVEDAHRRKRSL